MNKTQMKANLTNRPIRRKEDVFQEIVGHMKRLSREEMSDADAAQAASALISFCTNIVYSEYEKFIALKRSGGKIRNRADNSSGASKTSKSPDDINRP